MDRRPIPLRESRGSNLAFPEGLRLVTCRLVTNPGTGLPGVSML